MKPETAVRIDRTVGRWLVYPLHRFLYKASGGRVGNKTPQGRMILLTHTGRKSGKAYDTPLLCMPDGDGWVVVASNGGRPEHPSWFRNVSANPDVVVRDGRRRVAARAEVATPERKAELWPRLTDYYSGWAHYQTLTDRDLPVVELRPRA